MNMLVKRLARIAGTAALVVVSLVQAAEAKDLQPIRYGFAFNAITPVIINVIVAEEMGYFAEEGITVEPLPLGTLAATSAQMAAERLEVAAGSAQFALPIVAKGEAFDQVAFFETAYPFKWAVAVNPESVVQSLGDLKGKRVGVSSFGISDHLIGKALFRLVDVDPEKDIEWIAVGAGVTAGQALKQGQIDALLYFDTAFGAIEAAGIPLRYVDLPKDKPAVGGIMFWTRPQLIAEHRDWLVGFGRGVAKAQEFILANPRAAADIFIDAYPEAAPKGKSREEQIRAIEIPIVRRMPLFKPYNTKIEEMGFIDPKEIQDEVNFLGLKGQISDPLALIDNQLAKEINDFDKGAIRDAAKSYTPKG